nr:G kinase-anchoring protein 1-A [Parasteatoda tepidariorum]
MKAVNASRKQWEEWKQKDSEFVSETNEQDLQEALPLSKIDYEKEKDAHDAIQREIKQPVVEEFNFFDKIAEDAAKIITKEQNQEQYRINPVIESARLLQYQEDMRKKDEEIATSNESVQNLKAVI